MNFTEMKEKARINFAGRCRVCPVCNGVACAGEIPGMGGVRTGETFKRNVAAWKEYGIVMRSMNGAMEPDTTIVFLGQTLGVPIMIAPIGGVPLNMTEAMSEDEYCEAVCLGANDAGTLAFTGDSGKEGIFEAGLHQLEKTAGKMIPTIKPRLNPAIIEYAHRAIAGGATMLACDIDAAVLINMRLFGQPVEPKTAFAIEEVVKALEVPFIIKGIMSGNEAIACERAGAAAVVVSNHGGRILDGMVGTFDILEDVVSAVKGKIPVIIDGGVRTGEDVFKALAMGADAVLIGRPAAIAAVGGGREGVAAMIDRMKQELKDAMMMTGYRTVGDIRKEAIRKIK